MQRRFCVVLALGFLAAFASVCGAGVPSPSASTTPHHVVVVGMDAGGVADPAGTLTFAIRHLSGNPYPDPLIVLDFSNSPGIELCSVQADPAVTVDCPTRTARFFGDHLGNATVRITGRDNRGTPGSQAPSCHLFADGVLMGIVPIAAADEDGNGLGAADISLWQQDYFSGPYWERSDFDGDGTLSAADLSIWLSLYFAGDSSRGCSGSACP